MDRKENSPKQKMTHRQAAAITGIVLLVLLYIVTFVVAIVDDSDSYHWFYIFLFATFAVPLLTWIYIWVYGKLTGKSTIADQETSPAKQMEEADSPDTT